jgi:hypothetical protein
MNVGVSGTNERSHNRELCVTLKSTCIPDSEGKPNVNFKVKGNLKVGGGIPHNFDLHVVVDYKRGKGFDIRADIEWETKGHFLKGKRNGRGTGDWKVVEMKENEGTEEDFSK